jgi:hypothetical protein
MIIEQERLLGVIPVHGAIDNDAKRNDKTSEPPKEAVLKGHDNEPDSANNGGDGGNGKEGVHVAAVLPAGPMKSA